MACLVENGSIRSKWWIPKSFGNSLVWGKELMATVLLYKDHVGLNV
jgi:hypothetical protein